MNSKNRFYQYGFVLLLLFSLVDPASAKIWFYVGGGIGLSTITGDNDTTIDVDLNGSDNLVLGAKKLAYDLLTETHAVLGLGRLSKSGYYTGLDFFADYQPSELTGQSSATRDDGSNLDYQILNRVSLKSPGLAYGVNWIQSLVFRRTFFVYSILGIERSQFVWAINTNYAASGNDFGVALIDKKVNRYGINFGLGVSHRITSRMYLRTEYVYTRYENLDLEGLSDITGGQSTDRIRVNAKMNPSHQSIRLMLTYLI